TEVSGPAHDLDVPTAVPAAQFGDRFLELVGIQGFVSRVRRVRDRGGRVDENGGLFGLVQTAPGGRACRLGAVGGEGARRGDGSGGQGGVAGAGGVGDARSLVEHVHRGLRRVVQGLSCPTGYLHRRYSAPSSPVGDAPGRHQEGQGERPGGTTLGRGGHRSDGQTGQGHDDGEKQEVHGGLAQFERAAGAHGVRRGGGGGGV